jgi:hypothetical protein
MTLSQLIDDTAQLLNDPNFSFASRPQMLRWVNESRRNCAKRTGCIRRLITGQSAFGASAQPGYAIPGAMQPGALTDAFPRAVSGTYGAVQNAMMTIPGVERYPFRGFFNPFLQAQYAGCDEVVDAVALSVNWGGTTRPTLDWLPWDDLQAYARAYAVLNTSWPSVWSVYNDGPDGEIWVFPVPSQATEMELDAFCLPKRVYTDDDVDAIPSGMQECLKFGAAALVFMARGRYAQAQMMENQFADQMGVARVAFDRGKTKSYYYSVP